MEIHVQKSTIIRPAQETPKQRLRNSDLDLIAPSNYVPLVFFYRRPNYSSPNFFDAGLLKEALKKILVPFHPVAGRLPSDESGRTEILCNGEGVLFVEAETSCVIDDFGDFAEGSKLLPLLPTFDDTKDNSSYPLMMTQVTRFKCGGVCLATRFHHILADGASTYHFVNSWAEMTRGVPISIPPFFDRTVLDFGQIKILKEKSKENRGSTFEYTRLEVLAAHIWRCVCKARELSDDQASKLHFPTNGRSKLNPPLPSGYFGNVVFTTALIALSGNILSEPLNYTVERIHRALERMNDEYLKSALAYLRQQPDPTVLRRGAHTYKCPNFNIVYLANMPIYDANFGWGPPMFSRLVNTYFEGVAHIYPSPSNDGSLTVFINLETHHVQPFKKLFYEIFQHPKNARSRY
ncbi:Shikimate O-hydroxycinnamoyltransferase [Citrus sinensis]|uniref:Shikimate O-hydroxycinnamoyltransferase n=1 Tax=Citrus sinensis TaxID=2711 RepID=A0ACB8P8A7_CITSI|nr:Shikimate O-hydroxycinnamoyltransferase [Citrus sinensis]